MRAKDNSFVQLLPVSLISQWRNPEFSPNDDQALVDDIEQHGIIEPLVLGVGVWSRRIRLDTGNHRIYLCPEMGIEELPVIARVWNYCAFENGNGDHSFNCDHIKHDKQWIEDEYFARPDSVIDIHSLLQRCC